MEGNVIQLTVDLDQERIGAFVYVEAVDGVIGGTDIDDLPGKVMCKE